MPTILSSQPTQNGTYIVTISFIDENGDAFSPVTLFWSLVDINGDIVNNREDVEISNPTSEESIVLSGDDLAVTDELSTRRIVLISGTYNSTLGNGLPLVDSVAFTIRRQVSYISTIRMTLEQMCSLFGIYTGDNDKNDISIEERVQLLNTGQDDLLQKLNRHIITTLDITVPNRELDDNGAYDLLTFPYEILSGNRGIDGIKLTDGKFCHKISFEEKRRYNDRGRTFTNSDPVYYIRGNNLYVEPIENTIDIYCQRVPVKMALETANSSAVDCEIDGFLHGVIVGLAVEPYVDKIPSAARVYNKALKTIEELNAKYTPTESITHDFDDYEDKVYTDYSTFPINVTQEY